MQIVVDAMGGDHAPKNIVDGVIEAVKEWDVHITLVGIEQQIRDALKSHKYLLEQISVCHAEDVVGMHEPAITPLRKKKKSSIAIGINLIKKENYDAFVSAGNTGAIVAASTIRLGMLKGAERPAIGTVLPTVNGVAFMIDAGANTEAKPKHLLHSAQMADIYVREVLDIKNPTIGLLNIGEEEGKGSGFEKETHKLIDAYLPNFIGNVEANEIYKGKADCIICDGFVGNIALKISEGLVDAATILLRREIKKSPIAIFGAMLMKSRLNYIKKLTDYSEYGGAPLLGVNGIVMIGHGRSSPKAVKNAIRAAREEVNHKILSRMEAAITGDGT